MAILHVVAAAVLDPRGLLLVSKRSAPHVFFLPGGKPERGESALECLDRELQESRLRRQRSRRSRGGGKATPSTWLRRSPMKSSRVCA